MDDKNTILKPPTALIDCCILASWIHYDPDQPRQVKSRDDIFNAVFKRFSEGSYPSGIDIALSSEIGSETWGSIYDEWFTNFNIPNYSIFRITFWIFDNIQIYFFKIFQ